MPAGAPPATPTLASASSIRCQPHCQSSRTTRSPRVHPDALTFAIRQTDRSDPRRPTSSSHAPWLNPHSACGSAGAPPTAISCLGAFWTPAASVGGGARHRRRPKTCTIGDICSAANCALLDHLVGEREQRWRNFDAECLGGLAIDHQLELPHRGNSRAHRDAHKLAGLRFTRSVGLADKPCGRAGIGAAIFTKNLLISAFVGPWKRRQFLLYSRCCSGVGKLGKQRSIKRLFSRRPRLPCEFLIPAGGEGYEL
jgi:hypothetical protein